MFEMDYALVGKHATYLKYLVNEVQINGQGIFERYIDVYMNAAVYGLLYNRTAKRDTTSSDRANILAGAFNTCRNDCTLLYRLIMLLEQSTDVTPEERVNRAFRHDADEHEKDKLKANMDLFHSYVFGGIEVMHEKYTDGCTTQDDYLEKIYSLMNDFKEEIQGISFEDKLSQLIG